MHHILEKISLSLAVTFLIFLSYIGSHTAYAASLHPTSACQYKQYYSANLSAVNALYYPESHCNSTNALVFTYIGNCDETPHDAQTDTWQTQVTHSGGTRYAETGRSGIVTYPGDCNYYSVQESYLDGFGIIEQLPDPSYGCVWLQVDTQTIDYQCGQFPTR